MQASDKVTKARDLVARGLYADASHHFEEALEESPDEENVSLRIEFASMKLSQGLWGECDKHLMELHSRIDRNTQEPQILAVFDLLRAISSAALTVKMESPLLSSVEIYNQQLLDRSEADFDSSTMVPSIVALNLNGRSENVNVSQVTIAVLYHNLLTYARLLGYRPGFRLPSFSAEFQSSLVRHLLVRKRFDEALQVCRMSSFSDQTSNTGLLQEVLAADELPTLVRAQALWSYADNLRCDQGDDRWLEVVATAANLFDDAQHATGALEIRVYTLKHSSNYQTTAEHTEELWAAKGLLEKAGNFGAAMGCLGAIVWISTHGLATPSASLRSQVQEDWSRFYVFDDPNSCKPPRILVNVLDWQSTICNTSRDLEYLEHFYKDIADLDAPNVIFYVLRKLRQEYSKIGETEKAAKCFSRRPETLPRKIFIDEGLDPFDAWLKAISKKEEVTDTEGQVARLRSELDKVQGIVANTVDMEHREAEARRLLDIASTYIGQYKIRGEAQIDLIGGLIYDAIEAICNTLDSRRARLCRGELMLCNAEHLKAELAFIQPTPEVANQLMKTAACLEEEAIALYERGDHQLEMGMAKSRLGLTYKISWQVLGDKPFEVFFDMAVTNLADALAVAEKFGPVSMQRRFCQHLVLMWRDRFRIHVEENVIDLKSTEAYSMLLKWANKADELAAIERNEVSMLPRQRAVTGKQSLQSAECVLQLQQIMGDIYEKTNDDLSAWEWLQKARARSLSDMLALGINIPAPLRTLVEADADLTRLLDEEKRLAEQVRNGSVPYSSETWQGQNKLQAHRDAMRLRAPLREVLDLREGRPEPLTSLTAIITRSPYTMNRRILLVDWTIRDGCCAAFVVSDAGLHLSKTTVTEKEMDSWKTRWAAACKQAKKDGFYRESYNLLKKLFEVVKELVAMTAEGDLLVFCPDDVLRGIPLHAAVISNRSGKMDSLLERNPIVYAASMTSFAHCAAREMSRQRTGRDIRRSYVAVYERTDNVGSPAVSGLSEEEEKLRNECYESVRNTAQRVRAQTAVVGRQVTHASFVSALQVDRVCFLGHCDVTEGGGIKPTNVLQQGLELGSASERSGSHVFTTSDLFAVDVIASHVALLACSSANEALGAPEDPLGIISALLCAGATSVIGTMWKLDLSTAKLVMESLEETDSPTRCDGVIDLAVALQRVVKRLRMSDNGRAPYQWASLVLHGAWFLSDRVD